jgi:CRP/FNR family transcriptional regulator, cyclic AMP receptor protein
VAHQVVNVLDEDPELREALSSERRRRAASSARAAVIEQGPGDWHVQRWAENVRSGLGLLVLDGLLLRRVGLQGRFGSELLSGGDLLRPWQPEDGFVPAQGSAGWRVIQRSRLAVLDLDFAGRIASYPEIQGQLLARAVRRCRNLTINMAILQRARTEERLHLLLWSFANRWGRIHPDGVFVPMSLTHAMLAELLAARRPTVTAALNQLERDGMIIRRDRAVLLKGAPPQSFVELAGSVGRLAQPERSHRDGWSAL